VTITSQAGSADELNAILEQALADPDFSLEIVEALADFMNRLPAELGKDDGLLRQVREGSVADLILDSVAALSSRVEEPTV
jgi:hypothetical protein